MNNVIQMVGASAACRAIENEIECAANTDAKVLITGESGVGKEVVAKLIHHRSRRSRSRLVTINCAGIPDTLLASELFGHVRGSFTDAYRDKEGWLEQANGGTIFMDEIGEMSTQMQSLLLRFLENGEIQRVGSERRTTSVDVRVITATNRRLLQRVASGDFREDLFYRLNVVHIEIPPLRERREDVPVLLAHFLRECSLTHHVEVPELSTDAQAQLEAYAWPGNVRQLRNVVERLVVRAGTGVINSADLPREVMTLGEQAAGGGADAAAPQSRVARIFEEMVRDGKSFWSVVHQPFMDRDLTREDLRALVRQGLALTRGSYKSTVQLFNMPPEDYKRFLNFLRKFQCQAPIDEFRALPVHVPDVTQPDTPQPASAGFGDRYRRIS